MEALEPFGRYEDEWQPNSHSVTLKDGIDIHQLQRGEGTVFEVDPTAPLAGANKEEEGYNEEEVLQHLNYDCINMEGADSDSEEALSPFERLAAVMEDLSGDGGVLKRELKAGIGEIVPEKALVRVHYNGYLEFADEPYDSSRLRGKQHQFRLGNEEVIPGWDIAVKSMRRNELSQFLIRPEYAFREMGCPPRIPQNATILFEIELLGFIDYSAADGFQASSREDQQQATLEQLLAVADTEREVGNDFFQQNNTGKAVGRYLKAIRILEAAHLKDEEEERLWKTSLKKLYLNLSLCNLKQRKTELAISNCQRVLELDDKNVKACFRLGQAYMQLSNFEKSKKYLVRAGKLSPGNEEIRQELKKLDSAVKKFKSMEKSMYTMMFQQTPGAASTGHHTQKDKVQPQFPPKHTRETLQSKLRAFRENSSMVELVLPGSLSREEVAYVEELAKELGLKTEKNPASGVRVFKPGVQPEDFELR